MTLGTVSMGNYNIPNADDTLKAHYESDFEEINQYKGIERDDAFIRIAINNNKSHPFKYAENITYNIGKLIFLLPFLICGSTPQNFACISNKWNSFYAYFA